MKLLCMHRMMHSLWMLTATVTSSEQDLQILVLVLVFSVELLQAGSDNLKSEHLGIILADINKLDVLNNSVKHEGCNK